MIDFSKKPDFVNENGFKWWLNKDATDYARKENSSGISLDVAVYAMETPERYRTMVIVSRDRKILAESESLEGIGMKIDMMKLLEKPQ